MAYICSYGNHKCMEVNIYKSEINSLSCLYSEYQPTTYPYEHKSGDHWQYGARSTISLWNSRQQHDVHLQEISTPLLKSIQTTQKNWHTVLWSKCLDWISVEKLSSLTGYLWFSQFLHANAGTVPHSGYDNFQILTNSPIIILPVNTV
jgi:hypothetical protein